MLTFKFSKNKNEITQQPLLWGQVFGSGLILFFFLRDEFHFSDVHGAMNRSGSRAK